MKNRTCTSVTAPLPARLLVGALVVGCFVSAGALGADAPTSENNARLRKALKEHPEADTNRDGVLTRREGLAFLKKQQEERAPVQGQGLRQANTMGGGQAPVPETGVFRVFLLMGQSNMTGSGRAHELDAAFRKSHERIRIWANERWEYFVPTKNFGPGVSMAHDLAAHWPNDTIGIVKVAIGGTGILAFAPDWSREQADRSGDGRKGSLYKDLMDALAAARQVSTFEVSGLVWKQGGKDMRKQDLAAEYKQNFAALVTRLRKDVERRELPVFVLTYHSVDGVEQNRERLKTIRPYAYEVLRTQASVDKWLPHAVPVHHGKLPTHADGIHYNTEGQMTLGRMTARAVKTHL
jgi:hypothetical protein